MKDRLRSWPAAVPGVRALSTYERAWLSKDIVAGLVLTALLVPQGMAYAELAGLPPITGLYTSILALFGYWLMGPSKVLVLGPDSALGPMIAATILPLMGADKDPAKAIALASVLALMVGTIMLLAGLAKLGFIADLLSMPTQIGYMNGLALTIIVGQLPKMFGFSVDADGFIPELRGFVDGLVAGETVGAALAVGVGALIVILVLQRAIPKVPAVLVAVVLSILAVQVFDLGASGVSVVGTLPGGFPPFTIPHVSLSDLPLLLGGALGIVFVALADTISTASAFASRAGARVHGNREMVGIGTSNIAAGLFQGFPVSTSGSRTAVAEQAGAKTQLTGLVGAVAIIVILVAAPGLLRNLPQPALAAIVIAASLSLANIGAVARLWKQRKTEAWLAIVAFLGGYVLRGPPWDRDRRGAVDPGRVPADVVAVPGDPRRYPGLPGFPRSGRAPRWTYRSRARDLPVRCAADLRERPYVPRASTRAGRRPGRAMDLDRVGAHHRCGHDRR